MKGLLAVLALGVTVANPAAQTTAKVPSQRPPVAAPKSTSVRISVKDQDGASLAGVRLLLSGTAAVSSQPGLQAPPSCRFRSRARSGYAASTKGS